MQSLSQDIKARFESLLNGIDRRAHDNKMHMWHFFIDDLRHFEEMRESFLRFIKSGDQGDDRALDMGSADVKNRLLVSRTKKIVRKTGINDLRRAAREHSTLS